MSRHTREPTVLPSPSAEGWALVDRLRRVDPRVWPAALLGVLALAAYRELIGWDPAVALRSRVQGPEALLFEPSGGSPLLIFGVAAWMLWRRRRRIGAALGRPPHPGLALLLLTPAALLCLWANYVSAPDLLVASLAFLLPGLGAVLGGAAGARVLRLPGLFLLFAIPLPGVLVNEVIYPLQLLTARLTLLLLHAIGRSALLQGDQILTGDRIFQVIESCSGLRLMETLVMAAVVYAELLGRRPLWTLSLVVMAPLIGVLVNALRVLSIVLNPYSSFSAVHASQGIVMLVVGVVLLAGVDRLLEAVLAPRRRGPAPAPPSSPPAAPAPVRPLRGFVLAASLLGLLAGTTLWAEPWPEPPRTHRTLSDIPNHFERWRANGLDVDLTFLGTVGFSERSYRRFRRDGEEVDLFVGVDDRLRREASLISDKTSLPGTGWWIETSQLAGIDDLDASQLRVRSRQGEQLVLHWYDQVGPTGEEVLRALLALDRGPWRRPSAARVVRLATPVVPSAGGLEQAEARLRHFVPFVRRVLAELEQGRLPAPLAGRVHSDAGRG